MKTHIKSLLSLFVWLLSVTSIYAQTATVRGKVTDKGDKQSVIGASVTLIDKDGRTVRGASTDIEGNYSLPVADPTYRIAVSFLGYKSTRPFAVGDQKVINFQLESSSTSLTDVVITARKKSDNGTGMLIDDRDKTVSSFKVDAKDLEEMAATSIDQALQGRMPGVDIASISGDPGAPMQIRIRGTSTLNGSQEPLIVVDGMPYDISIPEDFNFATSDENGYGSLLNIAPADIKDITVLKDAAATAVYGSRAANGVLVITTKRGVIGKPRLAYTFKGSVSKQPSPIPTLNGNQYSSLILEEYYNANRQFSVSTFANEFQYDQKDPYNYYNFSNNTNWIDALTKRGFMQDHSFSINGGGEKAKYAISVNYVKDDGTTKGTGLDRITSRVNLDYDVSSKIHFRADFAYSHVNTDKLYTDAVRGIAYTKMPNQSVYEYDEFGNLSGNYFSPLATAQGSYASTYNPLAMALTGENRILDEHITPHFQLRYVISPSLSLQGDLQIDISNVKTKRFLPQIATGRLLYEPAVNVASDGDFDKFQLQPKVNLNYQPNIGEKHKLLTQLQYYANDYRGSGQNIAATNTASSFLQDPSLPARINTSSATASSTQSRAVSLMLQSAYSFNEKYYFTLSLRGDGSSKFGPGSRYGLFPGLSGKWRLSDEGFLNKIKKLDDLSLRLSWGQIGNPPRLDYSFYNTYQTYSSSVTYLNQVGVVSNNIELTNLKWETKTSVNAGVDLVLFGGRLTSTFDMYTDRIKDLFYNDLPIATYQGYPNVDLNVGTFKNEGWELNFTGNPLRTQKWRIDASFNIAYNQNLLTEVSRLFPRENKGKVTDNGVFKTYFQENNPYGSFYGYRFKGIYPDQASLTAKDKNGNPIIDPQTGQPIRMKIGGAATTYLFQPGDTMYEDINHDGLIDYKDIVYLGNGNPKFTGGFGTTVTFNGNLRASFNFSFRQGNDLINRTKIDATSMYGYNNQSTAVLRRWRKEGDITDIPRALYGTGYNYLASDKYVEDGSFLRLRSVVLRYDFTKKFTQKLGIQDLGGYLSADNLYTLTRYTGQDPEVGIKFRDAFSVIEDRSTTPPVRKITLGLTARF